MQSILLGDMHSDVDGWSRRRFLLTTLVGAPGAPAALGFVLSDTGAIQTTGMPLTMVSAELAGQGRAAGEPRDGGAPSLVGVVMGIAPWNAPVILGVGAIAVPLACGNTVVLKASEVCPGTPFRGTRVPFGTFTACHPASAAQPAVSRSFQPMKLNRRITTPMTHLPRAALALSLCASPLIAQSGDLTLELTGIAPGRGQVYVAVYDRPETFPVQGRQLTGQVVAASERQLTVRFTGLPPGQYAVVAFQDVNGNGRLDKNFFGMPKEPYGFSNGARGAGGPPRFEAAAVTLGPDATTRVDLR